MERRRGEDRNDGMNEKKEESDEERAETLLYCIAFLPSSCPRLEEKCTSQAVYIPAQFVKEKL